MTRAELNELLMECYLHCPDIQENGDQVPMLETIAAWAHMKEPSFEESDRDWMCEQLMSLARVLQDAAHIIQETPVPQRSAEQSVPPFETSLLRNAESSRKSSFHRRPIM